MAGAMLGNNAVAMSHRAGRSGGMRRWAMMSAAVLAPAIAEAETLQSESLEAEMARRPVTATSQDGDVIQGQQVYVTMRRRDGQPIGPDELGGYVGFAETAACKGGKVLVSLIVGVAAGTGKYEVLCAGGS